MKIKHFIPILLYQTTKPMSIPFLSQAKSGLLCLFLLILFLITTHAQPGKPAAGSPLQAWLEASLLVETKAQAAVHHDLYDAQFGADTSAYMQVFNDIVQSLRLAGLDNDLVQSHALRATAVSKAEQLNDPQLLLLAQAVLAAKGGVDSLLPIIFANYQQYPPGETILYPFSGDLKKVHWKGYLYSIKDDSTATLAAFAAFSRYYQKHKSWEKLYWHHYERGNYMWRQFKGKDASIAAFQEAQQLLQREKILPEQEAVVAQHIDALQKGSPMRVSPFPAIHKPITLKEVPYQPLRISQSEPYLADPPPLERKLIQAVLRGDTMLRSNFLPPDRIDFMADTLLAGVPTRIRASSALFNEKGYLNIKELTSFQGLPGGEIMSIAQDKNGQLWFTSAAGLTRYDGHFFYQYGIEQGLPTILIDAINFDGHGNLWMTSDAGIICFNGTHFIVIPNYKKLQMSTVDASGTVWFMGPMNSSGLIGFRGDSLLRYGKRQGLGDRITAFISRADGLWFFTDNFGIYHMNDTYIVHYNSRTGLPGDGCLPAVGQTQDGGIHFVSVDSRSMSHVLEIIDNQLYQHNTASSIRFDGLMVDRKDRLWLWDSRRLYRIDGHETKQFDGEAGLQEGVTFSLFEDRDSRIWRGTNKGLEQIDDVGLTGIRGFNDRSNMIFQADTNEFWVLGYPLLRYKNGEKQFIDLNGADENRPMNIIKDSRGRIWLGCWGGGLYIIEGEKMRHYGQGSGLPNTWITSFTEDPSGNIWIGSFGGGLYKYDGRDFTQYPYAGIPDDGMHGAIASSPFFLQSDNAGTIWMSAESGVSKLQDERYTYYTSKDGFPGENLHTALPSAFSNDVYVSSTDGVMRIRGEEVVNMAELYNWEESQFATLREDHSGGLWMISTQGLYRWKDNRLMHMGAAEGFRNPGAIDGRWKITRGIDQRLWFPAEPGFGVDVDAIFPKGGNHPPQLQLHAIRLMGQAVNFRAASLNDSLGSDFDFRRVSYGAAIPFQDYPSSLTLPHNINELLFEFVGIDWPTHNQLTYTYRLLGLRDAWSPLAANFEAKFTNLGYGDYVFEVKAVNKNGVWSETVQYPFTILPPWWHTWWARVLYLLAIVLLIRAYIQWRTASLKRKQRFLEEEVAAATNDIRLKKDEIEQQRNAIAKERDRSEDLLRNILPAEVAEELKAKGSANAQLLEEVTVLFTDFKGFTAISAGMAPADLVRSIHAYFSAFDQIMESRGIEKIKTIGDAYMAAGGLPTPTDSHAVDVVLAAFDILAFVEKMRAEQIEKQLPYFDIRIGIHTGPVVAGIVGVKKFAYDIWGDTVNTAAHMESAGAPDCINISQRTYEKLRHDPRFAFESRGKVAAKGKGKIAMYFVRLAAGA